MNLDKFITDLLDGKKKKTLITDQLYKLPVKDTNGDNPTFDHITPGYIQFADLLYLPNDKGYVYALVVTDQGSRLVDAEPLKDRKVTDILAALKVIFSRKILDKPKVIVIDNGKEFGKLFTSTLHKFGIGHKAAEPYRSRSVSLVERKNQTIGKIIHKILMQAESAGYHSSQWTDYLPKIIQKINDKVKEISLQKPKEIKLDIKSDIKSESKPLEESITSNPDNKIKMFNIDDEVRVALDVPIDTNGNKLHGKFRSSDIRWNPKIRTVRRVLLKPGQPIMYILDGDIGEDKIGDVAYTYNQLQKVATHERVERQPLIHVEENRQEVKEIIDKKVVDGVTKYLVHWKNEHKNKATWESRDKLIEDLGIAYMNRVDKKLDKKKPEDKPNEKQSKQSKKVEEATYEVEDILERKKYGKTFKYLVKWKGYSVDESTWEPKANLIADLGKEYMAEIDARFD